MTFTPFRSGPYSVGSLLAFLVLLIVIIMVIIGQLPLTPIVWCVGLLELAMLI